MRAREREREEKERKERERFYNQLFAIKIFSVPDNTIKKREFTVYFGDFMPGD